MSQHLFGRPLVMPFRVTFSQVVSLGCTVQRGVVWNFSDGRTGLMAIPNMIGVLILSGLIAREAKLDVEHDPKREASRFEIEAFMKGDPGWEDWTQHAR